MPYSSTHSEKRMGNRQKMRKGGGDARKHERGDGKQGKSAGKETGGMTAKRRPKARLCLVYLRLSVRPFVRLSVSVSLLPAVSRIRYDTYSN